MRTQRIATVRGTSSTSTTPGSGRPALVTAHLLTAENGNRTVTISDGHRTVRLSSDQAARLTSAITRSL